RVGPIAFKRRLFIGEELRKVRIVREPLPPILQRSDGDLVFVGRALVADHRRVSEDASRALRVEFGAGLLGHGLATRCLCSPAPSPPACRIGHRGTDARWRKRQAPTRLEALAWICARPRRARLADSARSRDTAPRHSGSCCSCYRSPRPPDRKSTRLNSSHVKISYAVFCLKKKKNKTH